MFFWLYKLLVCKEYALILYRVWKIVHRLYNVTQILPTELHVNIRLPVLLVSFIYLVQEGSYFNFMWVMIN